MADAPQASVDISQLGFTGQGKPQAPALAEGELPGFKPVAEATPATDGELPGFKPIDDGELPGFKPVDETTFLERVGENFVQVAGGLRDAAQNFVDLTITPLATELEKTFPLTGPINELTGLNFPTPKESKFPEIDKPKDLGGALNRGVAQFLSAFIPLMGATKAANIAKAAEQLAAKAGIPFARALGAFAEAEVAALAADQLAFNPQDPRLSNFIQQFPELANPVTEYLASDPKDSEAQNRFELALEGAGLGALLTPVAALFRGVRLATRRHVLAQAEEEAIEDIAPRQAGVGTARDDEVPGTAAFQKPADEPQFAGNINLSRINSEEDAKQVLLEAAEQEAGRFDAARRGTISESQTRLLASDLGMTEKMLLSRRKGQAFNAEEALAARNMLVSSAEQVVELGKLARGGSDAQVVQFQQAFLRHVAIQEQVSGLTAEAGRALRQFQIPSEGKERALKEIIEGQGGRGRIEEIADLAASLDSPEQVARFAREARKATTTDKIFEVWINALLSGPQTHVVNFLSNSLVQLWTIPEHVFAAGLGIARGGTDRVALHEVASRLYGMGMGFRDGLRAGAKSFITEKPSDIFSKLDVPRQETIPGAIGKAVRLPGRALIASDEFFKSIGYRGELHALAMRTGLQKGLRGNDLAKHVNDILTDPPDDIKFAAIDVARYKTFTNPLGDVGQKIQGIRGSTNPLVAVPARLLVPFLRTPVNIVKFAGERSPLAPLSKQFRDAIKKGGAERDIATARMALGSGVGAAVATLAAEGKITGGGPTDPDLRRSMRDAGWEPYSLKIGDRYYSYARLEPLGIIFGVAADYAEIAGQADGPDADDLATKISMAFAKNITSKTYLKSLSETIQALHDPDRYGERFIRNLAGTIIPTGLAQIARSDDPIIRDTQTSLERIKSRIPGYREDLPAIRNIWGTPVSMAGGLGPDLISPLYTNKASKDKLLNEIVRLKVKLTMPDRKVRETKLEPKEYWGFVEAAGKPAKLVLDSLVASPQWETLPDFSKAQMIKNTVQAFRDRARKLLFVERPEIVIDPAKKKIEQIQIRFGEGEFR